MGFSQNWRRVPELPAFEFAAFGQDVRDIIDQLPAAIPVGNYGTESDEIEPPIITSERVAFTVPGSGMEWFGLDRVYRVDPDRGGKIFQAVKTLTRYAPLELNLAADTLVVAVLIAAQEWFGAALTFETDYNNPASLESGIKLFTDATGRTPKGRVNNWALPDFTDIPVVFEVTPLGAPLKKRQVGVVVGVGGYSGAAALAGEQVASFLDDYGAVLSCIENPAYTGSRVWTLRAGRTPGASMGKTYLVKLIG